MGGRDSKHRTCACEEDALPLCKAISPAPSPHVVCTSSSGAFPGKELKLKLKPKRASSRPQVSQPGQEERKEGASLGCNPGPRGGASRGSLRRGGSRKSGGLESRPQSVRPTHTGRRREPSSAVLPGRHRTGNLQNEKPKPPGRPPSTRPEPTTQRSVRPPPQPLGDSGPDPGKGTPSHAPSAAPRLAAPAGKCSPRAGNRRKQTSLSES